MSVGSACSAADGRALMIEQAFRLEYVTLAWMMVEAAVAIGSGICRGQPHPHGLRRDQLIELASACVVVW